VGGFVGGNLEGGVNFRAALRQEADPLRESDICGKPLGIIKIVPVFLGVVPNLVVDAFFFDLAERRHNRGSKAGKHHGRWHDELHLPTFPLADPPWIRSVMLEADPHLLTGGQGSLRRRENEEPRAVFGGAGFVIHGP
jgi:hypothetical protein